MKRKVKMFHYNYNNLPRLIKIKGLLKELNSYSNKLNLLMCENTSINQIELNFIKNLMMKKIVEIEGNISMLESYDVDCEIKQYKHLNSNINPLSMIFALYEDLEKHISYGITIIKCNLQCNIGLWKKIWRIML